MRWTALITLALVTTPTATAGSYGAGGVWFADGHFLDSPATWNPASGISAPGRVECMGGEGWGVGQKRGLAGGEATFCAGEQAMMSYGGVQAGRALDLGPVYGALKVGLGGGWASFAWGHDEKDAREHRANHAFIYARPTVSVGVPLGFSALEFGVYALLPASIFQEAVDKPLWAWPQFGSQVSVLFGNFRDRRW